MIDFIDLVEDNLFTFSKWENVDSASFSFYDCILGVQIGSHPSGTFFPKIFIDYDIKEITLFNSNGWQTYEFLIKIGNRKNGNY
jgi:hypothetical protein